MWSVDDIVKAVRGTPHRVEKRTFSSVSTDSRNIEADQLFVPLKGPRFDGHGFIHEAYGRSGGGSLCDRTREDIYHEAKGTIILVDDTNQALLDLARYKRARTPGTFIAITGSNGKTTTKELLVHIIGDRYPIVFNEKNYNNQVGVAKTLLGIEGEPKYAIFELGTNHKGEIRVLAGMVQPDISLITNVNASHLEGLSDVEGVFEEKISLFEATSRKGHLFVNGDDPRLAPYAKKSALPCSTFAIDEKADFMLQVTANSGLDGMDILLTLQADRVGARTRLLGRHNLYNVLAAAALARFIGIDNEQIAASVATFEPYKGRFKPVRSPGGFTVIDDTYNANPASMESAVATLQALPCKGKRIAILGGMKELGDQQEEYHRELGRFLSRSTLSLILLFGAEMKPAFDETNNGRSHFFDDKRSLVDFMTREAGQGDIVLVKGSRALGMDEIVEDLV